MKDHPPPANLAALAHPANVLAVLTLALNDHLLKQAWPGWWTGKLSDFAFCVVAPLVLAAPFGRRARLPAVAATAAAFTVLQLWPPFGAWFSAGHVADAADLIALPFLAVPLWIWRAPSRAYGAIILPLATTALVATSPYVAVPDTTWPCDGVTDFPPGDALLIRVSDHGSTATDGFLRGISLTTEDGEPVPWIVGDDGSGIAICAIDGLEPDTTYIWTVGPWDANSQEEEFADVNFGTITFHTWGGEGVPVATGSDCSALIVEPVDDECGWDRSGDSGVYE